MDGWEMAMEREEWMWVDKQLLPSVLRGWSMHFLRNDV